MREIYRGRCIMTAIAPHISDFLRERLPAQIGAKLKHMRQLRVRISVTFEFALNLKIPCGSLN